MDLVEGVYENLISKHLNDKLESLPSDLISELGEMDNAESPSMLSEYVGNIIKRRFEDGDLTLDDKKNIINRIIGYITEDQEDKV